MVPAEQFGRNIFSQAVTALLTWKIIEGYKFPVQFLAKTLSLETTCNWRGPGLSH